MRVNISKRRYRIAGELSFRGLLCRVILSFFFYAPHFPVASSWRALPRGPTLIGLKCAARLRMATRRTRSLPLRWSEKENIKWKTEIPLRGWSTPAIADGKIWMTTADPGGHDFYVISVDESSGKILVNKKLFHCDNPESLGNDVNSYATPSPVIEPGRVYVNFGCYGTACLDTKTADVDLET